MSPRPQQIQELRFVRPVHHDRQPDGVGRLARPAQRFEVGLQPFAVAADPHLDAQDPVAVLLDDPDGGLRIDNPGIEEQLVRDHQTDRRDVEQGEDAGLRALDHVLPEARERGGAGRSAVDNRGHPTGHPDEIGVHRDGDAAVVDVPVQVDQAGRYDTAPGVEHLSRPLARNGWLQRLDSAARDRDIADGGQPLRRIDDPPAGDQQAIGGLGRRPGRRQCGERQCGGPQAAQERAAAGRMHHVETCGCRSFYRTSSHRTGRLSVIMRECP